MTIELVSLQKMVNAWAFGSSSQDYIWISFTMMSKIRAKKKRCSKLLICYKMTILLAI